MSEIEETSFFAAVKFIGGRNIEKCHRSDSIYVVDDVGRRYWPFKPKHLDDYDNKTQKFGAIKGEHMFYLKVVRLANNYDDLGYGRLQIPKRWSEGVVKEPLKLFEFVEEGLASKKATAPKIKKVTSQSVSKGDVLKDTPDVRNNDVMRNNGDERDETDDAKEEMSLGDADQDNAGTLPEVMPGESVKDDEDLVEVVVSSVKKNKKRKSTSPESTRKRKKKNKKHSKPHKDVDAEDEDVEKPDKCDNSAGGNELFTKDVLSSLTDHSVATKEEKSCPECKVKDLMLKEKDEELKVALEENKTLKSKDSLSKTEVLALLQENLKDQSSMAEDSFLKDVTYLVKDDYSEMEVPDGQVYCGNKIVVAKTDLFNCARGSTFGRRVARVIDAFYPKTQHQHFLSGFAVRAPATLPVYKITDEEVKAMKKILKAMPGWGSIPNADITTSNISTSIRNYTSQCLTNYLNKTERLTGDENETSKKPAKKPAKKPDSEKPKKNKRQSSSSDSDST